MSISVCMATYNGEKYVREQLDSILKQLGKDDEVVVVDDASTDGTLKVVADIQDTRIRMTRQSQNRGVIKTFAHAIQQSRGDILFLADQDDIWCEDKVRKVEAFFASHPDVTLVLSDYKVIDGSGNISDSSRRASRRFRPGVFYNILQNRYHGCAMAFRRSILEYCLPFPDDIPMHDLWIGIVNDLIGRTGYLGEALVFYRRHDANASRERHASVGQMMRWRWRLTRSLISLYTRKILAPRLRMLRLV
jgi:glycosyltransferase involved in cell wall biosynthesis